ncbi:hypothetical protein J2850_001452 [Azospirillum picis]|uniref:Uncharacterized protein n=1 Tax=Azospirillum picis TaxID=488438 RepID=A0ABU0MFG5_9PROT|nr:hypothetical protein [Azospirillum picis]MDQ0532182.1 hypothetical protein [Azospirillum picis]
MYPNIGKNFADGTDRLRFPGSTDRHLYFFFTKEALGSFIRRRNIPPASAGGLSADRRPARVCGTGSDVGADEGS